MKKHNLVTSWELFLLMFAFASLWVSCSEKKNEKSETEALIDTFKTKSLSVDYAIGFDLEYKEDYKILSIFNHYGQKADTISYLLLPQKAAIPEPYREYKIIRTPVQKLITMSSTHVGLIDALDAYDAVIGHPDSDHLYNQKFLRLMKEGKIKEVGVDANLNVEIALTLNPGAIIAVARPGQAHNSYTIMEEAGVPVIYNSEWQETSLLARAEWIKVMAALVNKEEIADQKFNKIVKTYDSLKLLASNVSHKPLVIANTPFKGTWHVPGGNSYVAKLINDAGGDYYWKDDKGTGSFIVSFEEAIKVGLTADIWLNVSMSGGKEKVVDIDTRLKNFKAFKTGQIYNFTNRESESGANDYWESGIVNADLILADLIKIFHPELLPHPSLFYYKKVE